MQLIVCFRAALFAALCVVSTTAFSAELRLVLDKNGNGIVVGDLFNIAVVPIDLPHTAAGTIGAFDFTFAFDSTRLSLEGVTFGSNLDVFGLGDVRGITQMAPNLVNVYEVSLDSPADLFQHQLLNPLLITLTFQAIAGGFADISTQVNALADANGNAINIQSIPASIFISAVSEPTPALLFVAGFVALLVRRVGRAVPSDSTHQL